MKTHTRSVPTLFALAALALAPLAAAQAPAPVPAPPDPKATLEDVHARNVTALRYSALAAQKATAPSLKELANRVTADHTRLEQELKALSAERGIPLTADDAIANAPQFKQGFDRLNALTGAEFDRVYAEMWLADRVKQVDELKALRDRTPGKDAKLKKWLDGAVDVMEKHRNQARVAMKDVIRSQRQGRPAPK